MEKERSISNVFVGNFIQQWRKVLFQFGGLQNVSKLS